MVLLAQQAEREFGDWLGVKALGLRVWRSAFFRALGLRASDFGLRDLDFGFCVWRF